MKILVLSNNFPPEVSPGANRTWESCKRWARAGADVTVVTCVPHFPAGKLFGGYRNRLKQSEMRDNVKVVRVWTFLAPNAGFLLRVINFVTYGFMAFWVGLFIRTDVIFATSPQLFTPMAATLLAFFKRRPWVMEVRDIWPESIVAVGVMQKGALYRLLEAIELRLYKSAKFVVILSDAFRPNLTGRGVPDAKLRFVPNGVDREDFFPRPADPALRAKLGLDGKFTLGFIGTLGLAHGLDFIFDVARKLDTARIHFLFVGDGAMRGHLEERVKAETIANVTILNPVPRQEVPALLASVDCALINLKRSDTFESVLPSKILEAAAMERPILLGVRGAAQRLIEQFHAGIAYEPEDETSFLAALARFEPMTEEYKTCQEGCRALSRAYDRDQLAQTLLGVLEEAART